MAKLFDDPQFMATAEAALHALRQGQRPVEDYIVDFCNWAADTGWNEAALRFKQAKLELISIKDELARVESPTT